MGVTERQFKADVKLVINGKLVINEITVVRIDKVTSEGKGKWTYRFLKCNLWDYGYFNAWTGKYSGYSNIRKNGDNITATGKFTQTYEHQSISPLQFTLNITPVKEGKAQTTLTNFVGDLD